MTHNDVKRRNFVVFTVPVTNWRETTQNAQKTIKKDQGQKLRRDAKWRKNDLLLILVTQNDAKRRSNLDVGKYDVKRRKNATQKRRKMT